MELLRLVDAPSDRARALELRRLLFGVASNGAWRRWRKVGGVPETATPLQSLVFEVLSRGKDPAVPTVPAGRALQKLAALTR